MFRWRFRRGLFAHLVVGLAFWGCAKPADQARQYELQGQILAIRPDAHEVLITHGDIKNFMPGMTMPFKVRDGRLLTGRAPGDLVTAQLTFGAKDAWLATLDKTGTAALEKVVPIPPAAFITPLKPGDHVPDAALSDQDERKLSLVAWHGWAVAITFIYIRCPLPQFCPMMDRRFREVQRAIQGEPALAGRTKLLSVSFDPDHDTPAALKAHAAKLGADPNVWRLATASREILDRFAATFGVNVVRENDRTITHNLRTVVVGPDGRVVTVYDGTEWTSARLIDDLRGALQAR